MSYAAVAATNAPPPSEQPHPDPALLTTPADVTPADSAADDAGKVNVVPHDFKEHPVTVTSEENDTANIPPPPMPVTVKGPPPVHAPEPSKAQGKKDKAKEKLRDLKEEAHDLYEKAEEEGFDLYEKTKDVILRPPVAGGLIGVVNVGLLAGAAYALYTEPRYRQDARVLGSAAVGALALFGAEGALADAYLKTADGQATKRKAKAEGSYIYRTTREHVLRPGVLGGLVGVVNLGVLGALGYVAYDNWQKPHWDRRTVSAVSVGLLTLWGGEGYLASREDVQDKFQ